MAIERKLLRSEVRSQILNRIIRSEYEPNSRIKDTDIAQELGVSRTPVREALIRLAQEGFLEVIAGRGFRVRPLSAKEVQEIYPIVGSMEALALRTSARIPDDTLGELKKLARKIARNRDDPMERINLDMQWHRMLLSGCPNEYLHQLLDELKQLVWRYEYAYMRADDLVKHSAEDHLDIVEALANRRKASAIRLLIQHWDWSRDALLERCSDD